MLWPALDICASITMSDIEEAAPENSLIDLSGLEFEIK